MGSGARDPAAALRRGTNRPLPELTISPTDPPESRNREGQLRNSAIARGVVSHANATPPGLQAGLAEKEEVMGRGLLLWLLGVPIPVIILLWLFFGR